MSGPQQVRPWTAGSVKSPLNSLGEKSPPDSRARMLGSLQLDKSVLIYVATGFVWDLPPQVSFGSQRTLLATLYFKYQTWLITTKFELVYTFFFLKKPLIKMTQRWASPMFMEYLLCAPAICWALRENGKPDRQTGSLLLVKLSIPGRLPSLSPPEVGSADTCEVVMTFELLSWKLQNKNNGHCFNNTQWGTWNIFGISLFPLEITI